MKKYVEVPTKYLKYAKPSCKFCYGLGRIGYIIEDNVKRAIVCKCIRKNVELNRVPKKMVHKIPTKDKYKRDEQFIEDVTKLESQYGGGMVHADI